MSKSTECTVARTTLNVGCGYWVIMGCECSSPAFRGGCCSLGKQPRYWENSCSLLSAVNQKPYRKIQKDFMEVI